MAMEKNELRDLINIFINYIRTVRFLQWKINKEPTKETLNFLWRMYDMIVKEDPKQAGLRTEITSLTVPSDVEY